MGQIGDAYLRLKEQALRLAESSVVDGGKRYPLPFPPGAVRAVLQGATPLRDSVEAALERKPSSTGAEVRAKFLKLGKLSMGWTESDGQKPASVVAWWRAFGDAMLELDAAMSVDDGGVVNSVVGYLEMCAQRFAELGSGAWKLTRKALQEGARAAGGVLSALFSGLGPIGIVAVGVAALMFLERKRG